MPANDTRFWDRIARKYAANKLADPDAYARTLERTRHYLRNTDAVIEFGCGTGSTALTLAPAVARYVATDASAEMIAIAREKAEAERIASLEFAVAGADAPQPDASFDAALALNLLHLVRDRAGVLAGVHRMLRPGGLFISKTPCIKDANLLLRLAVPLAQVFIGAPFVAIVSAEALERDITAAGFEIVERARHGSRGSDARPFLVARKL
jgi:ubiquinone/menaquinone biosynthesis C-methylase UbiE